MSANARSARGSAADTAASPPTCTKSEISGVAKRTLTNKSLHLRAQRPPKIGKFSKKTSIAKGREIRNFALFARCGCMSVRIPTQQRKNSSRSCFPPRNEQSHEKLASSSSSAASFKVFAAAPVQAVATVLQLAQRGTARCRPSGCFPLALQGHVASTIQRIDGAARWNATNSRSVIASG